MTERELFEAWYKSKEYSEKPTLLRSGKYSGWIKQELWEAWIASASREGYKLVPVGDYAELVRSNRHKHEQNIELSKEVKILRERKKFYKSELNNMRCKYKVIPIEPTDEILKFLGGSKQEATLIYKAMIGVVE